MKLRYEVLDPMRQHFLMLDIDAPSWAHHMLLMGTFEKSSTYQRVDTKTTWVGYRVFQGDAVQLGPWLIRAEDIINKWIQLLTEEERRRGLLPGEST